MNPEVFSRDDLLRNLNPFFLGVMVIAVILIALFSWVGRHKFASAHWAFRGLEFISVSASFFLAFQIAARWVEFETAWPLVAISLLAGLIWGLISSLYDFEKTLVSFWRGALMLSLRLLALTTLIIILAQPVFTFLENREIDREVVVLIDDSASMQLSDSQLTLSEKLDRAAVFGNEMVIKHRPRLQQIQNQITTIHQLINVELNAIGAAPSPQTGFQSRVPYFKAFSTNIERGKLTLESLLASVSDNPVLAGDSDKLKSISERLQPFYHAYQQFFRDQQINSYIESLNVAAIELESIRQTIQLLIVEVDEKLYQSLSLVDQKTVEEIAQRTRADLARQIAAPVFEQLSDRYTLRFYRFNREVEEISATDILQPFEPDQSLRAETDLATAFERVIADSSAEALAGIVMLSDGRHTAAKLPEASLRQLAIQKSPLCSIPIGGNISPVDASIASLTAPESIYLDDRAVITAKVNVAGMQGKKIQAQLLCHESVVNELEINVTDTNFETELRFTHIPPEKGVISYQVKIDVDERELYVDNNIWDFKIAVTDDRTNVLLVDGYPRWEFRYLRNLFYGRDKSVHLQYVLLNPDTIFGMDRPVSIPADATRKFGEAEATELPRTPEDWLLFSIIILGDIEPNQLGDRDWQAINDAVTKRGALLVCAAGPRHMPHGFSNKYLRDLLPVTYSQSNGGIFTNPEFAYRIKLTSTGRQHPLMSQSASREINQRLWESFPPMRWRWSGGKIKESAEVLAYAESVASKASSKLYASNRTSVELALQQLSKKKQQEQDNALITTMRSGLGNVVLMSFDRTWRFRYGVGDTYHHRFWGQLARWGAGPILRSGVETVRLGTDRLSYTPLDDILVTAKLLSDNRQPINDATVFASIIKNGEKITTQQLSYRLDSAGLYECSFPGLSEPGDYQVVLEGNEVNRIINNNTEAVESISTELLILNTRNPLELAELTADREFLHRAARQTKGIVTELWELEKISSVLGAPKQTLSEQQSKKLWNTWPFLGAFLCFLTFEWVLRRSNGLV